MPRLTPEASAFDMQAALKGVAIDRARSIGPQIYDALRSRIIDNRFPPGTALSEKEVARICDISRTPLRAAIQDLAGEGLIIVKPQVGSVVAPHDAARVREAIFIRAAIEAAIARRLAETGVDEAALAPVLAAQKAAGERDDYLTFFRYDEQFHSMLARMAEVPNAWQMVQSVKAHIDRQRLLLMSSITGRSMRAYEDHVKLIEAISRGDASAAAAVMRDHVNSALETLEAGAQGP
ncbi:GntR family transcriptional regulator [Hoeflea poritis]|uniref:GntR family transcriptional regulator n=1 Tax=Hoeflea poritis TaxID=2993659 RepID=A0ABT4VS44_9HYPH|nr:GntR family transcriptional regulator [Hoeflea poritis]MDA4847481.1 GntR family transcriptional regulator [Hoeflea poritis]